MKRKLLLVSIAFTLLFIGIFSTQRVYAKESSLPWDGQEITEFDTSQNYQNFSSGWYHYHQGRSQGYKELTVISGDMENLQYEIEVYQIQKSTGNPIGKTLKKDYQGEAKYKSDYCLLYPFDKDTDYWIHINTTDEIMLDLSAPDSDYRTTELDIPDATTMTDDNAVEVRITKDKSEHWLHYTATGKKTGYYRITYSPTVQTGHQYDGQAIEIYKKKQKTDTSGDYYLSYNGLHAVDYDRSYIKLKKGEEIYLRCFSRLGEARINVTIKPVTRYSLFLGQENANFL